MNLYKYLLSIVILTLFLTGCVEKNELTLPVRVDFKISFPENSSGETYLTFTGGRIGIREVSFEGIRETGGDVYFETDPRLNIPPLVFNISSQPSIISDLDIPQGIFSLMKWDINLKQVAIEELNDNDIDPPYIGLAISGTYTYLSGETIPFIITVDDTEQFNARSFDSEGNSKIILSVNRNYEAILLLDPVYAFHSISRESMEDADVSDDSATPIIVISSEENDDLYEDLLYRIAQSAKVLLK